MHITSAQASDHTGLYACTASNSAGVSYRQFHIDVLMPPELQLSDDSSDYVLETITVAKGESIKLKCPTSGNPKPNIHWIELNGETIMQTDPSVISNSLDLVLNFTFSILKYFFYKFVWYFCRKSIKLPSP